MHFGRLSTIVEITLPYQALTEDKIWDISTIVEITLPYQARRRYFRRRTIYNSRNYITLLGQEERRTGVENLQQQKLHYLIRLDGMSMGNRISTIVEITLPYQAPHGLTIDTFISTIVEITLPYQAHWRQKARSGNLQQQKLHYLIRRVCQGSVCLIYNSRNYITLLGE